jgi:hypothetical protein
MKLEQVWQAFIHQLMKNDLIVKACWNKITGIPFLYLLAKENTAQSEIEHIILISSAAVMKGKRLHCQTVFVRNEDNLFVYRHRFLVPQEKMFCCGNLCADCIRFK